MKTNFGCAVLVGLLACWSLALADATQDFYNKPEVTYMAKDDYGQTVEYCTEILKSDPERYDAIYVRGVNYFRLKKYDEALADLNKIKGVNGIASHALYYIGLISSEKRDFYNNADVAYMAKDDYGQTVEYCTEILKSDPERHDAIYVRGVNYFRLKKYDEALADLNKIKGVNGIASHALYYIGLISSEKKDYQTALNALTGAVDLEPENAQYCLDAARVGVKADSPLRALALYKRANKIDPTNEEAASYIKARTRQ